MRRLLRAILLAIPVSCLGQIYTPQWGLFYNGEACPAGHLFSSTSNTPFYWALDKQDGNGYVIFDTATWTNNTMLGTNYNSISGGSSHSWLLDFSYPYECAGHAYWSNFDNGDFLLIGASLLHFYTVGTHLSLSTNDISGTNGYPWGGIVEIDFTTPYSSGSGTLRVNPILEYFMEHPLVPPKPEPFVQTPEGNDFPPVQPPGIPRFPFRVITDPGVQVKVLVSDVVGTLRSTWRVATNIVTDGSGVGACDLWLTNKYSAQFISCVVTNVH